MKVQDLIRVLSSMPPEAEVLVGDWNEAHAAPTPLERVELNDSGDVVLEDPDTQ